MRIRQAFFWPWLMTAAALAAEPAARVGYVEGDVFIQRAQGGRPERAEVGAALFDGDVLVTKNGRAQMAVPAAGTVRLGRNSTLNPHSGTSDGPRGGITPLVGREHRNVFEVRIPVLIAGTSEAATLRTTALSDSSNLAFGSPVSDEDINRQMALRKVSPVWPTPAPPSAAAPPVSDPPTVDKPLNASCFLRIPDDLPEGWWHALRPTSANNNSDGVPRPSANAGRTWSQKLVVSRDRGFVLQNNAWRDPGNRNRRFSNTAVNVIIHSTAGSPNARELEQHHLDWWIKEDSARYVTDAKKSIILNYTQGNGTQHYVKLIFTYRGCQVFLQLSSTPGANSDCTEAMALHFGRRLCQNIDRHFGGDPHEKVDF